MRSSHHAIRLPFALRSYLRIFGALWLVVGVVLTFHAPNLVFGLLFAAIAVAPLRFIVRTTRLSVTVGPETVVVRNRSSVHRVATSEVVLFAACSLSPGNFEGGAFVELRDGSTISLDIFEYRPSFMSPRRQMRRERQIAALNQWVGAQ